MPLNIVIGSGHAGIAAAAGLLSRGAEVLVVDVGGTLEPDAAALRARLAGAEPTAWSTADRDALSGLRQARPSDTMRAFGSDFMFRVPAIAPEWKSTPEALRLRPCFARGGLSNGWGASVLPYRDEDLASWPFRVAALKPHYAAAAALLGVAARRDALAPLFPAHEITEERPPALSRQAAELLQRLEGARAALGRLGVAAGQSRQAMGDGCRRCAMCLYGCPYGVIFNAADALARLQASGGLTYRPGLYAVRFAEDPSGVRLWVRDAAGALHTLQADRLFVAAGVLPSTLLALRSLDVRDEPVILRDSQHFYLPLLQRRSGVEDPAREARHTLAQVFVEIARPGARTVHTQVYTHNATYAPDMRARFAVLAALPGAAEALARRLLVAQTFLHSDDSPGIDVRLTGAGDAAALAYAPRPNPLATRAFAEARATVARVARLAGLLPLTPLVRRGAPGSSFHCGGTLPMRASPQRTESDLLGRPGGLRRVHVVDATVFPSIPATTISFSVMANAHRIATAALP